MFRWLSEIVLRSLVTKNNAAQKQQFLPWEKTEKIALIIGHSPQLNKSAIDKFIEGTKKFVEVFYVETRSKVPSYADWRCFSKKDATWLQLPNSKAGEPIAAARYDLVINTSDESDLFATALCSMLQGTCKCGSFEKFDTANLIIQPRPSAGLLDHLNETVRYLKMIRV